MQGSEGGEERSNAGGGDDDGGGGGGNNTAIKNKSRSDVRCSKKLGSTGREIRKPAKRQLSKGREDER